MLKIVFDSNIYIAAIAKRSFCFDLLDSALSDSVTYSVYISGSMVQEIEITSARLISEQLLQPDARDRLKSLLSNTVHIVEPTEYIQGVGRDSNDEKILECAVAARADLIISLDQDLISLKTFRGIAIVHPKTFFYMLPN